jgi:DNA polymerase gamma 1
MLSFRVWQIKHNRRKIPWKYSLSSLNILHNYRIHFSTKSQCKEEVSISNKCVTINPCGIQMLPRSIHRQIFEKENNNSVSKETLLKIQQHLSIHHLYGKSPSKLPDIDLKLPTLLGKNIAEHFEKIAEKQCGSYRNKLLDLTSHCIPDIPQVWNFAPGWTRYNQNGEMDLVHFPEEDAYVFDVEVCVKEGHLPTLATAVSKNYWYSWCSNQLFTENKVYFYFS